MPFILFTNTTSRFNASVSINPDGFFGLSSGFCHRYGIGKSDSDEFACLQYDAERNLVGIQLHAAKTDPGARKLYVHKHGATLRAKAFLDFFNIKLESTIRMIAKADEESGLIVLDISQAVVRKKSSKQEAK